MPPKKVEAPEKKPLIGRLATSNLKIGIVGKNEPRAGFHLKTFILNYKPFCVKYYRCSECR